MTDKILSLLGLSRRAGKLTAGFDAAAQAAKDRKAVLLLAAADISEKTFKNLKYEGDCARIETLRLQTTIEETGRACGVKAGVFAVEDEGFAKAIRTALNARQTDEGGSSL